MNYTTNYHLPQWVETDRIMMGDFNQAMETLDGGIAAAKATADTAKNTADTAESKADAAQSTANNAYCPENKPYVLGSYQGQGSGAMPVILGFQPSLVIVSGESTNDDLTEFGHYTAIASGLTRGMEDAVEITDNGFTIHGTGNYYPLLTSARKTYFYVAFR